ncbi:NAD(P)-binding protein [Hortaea werneckii]|uniref:Enoyl reductase (ER) domain-containing protein n=2 Tax=Hortaea werneckii TaxID=91943 RepID=A0A3M7IP09_HORWE|nr:NAD(P)-binding protein [Hortaea werneckii]OTA37162.1 hypothetical protein BTJ68_02948 [Hortaea werneckii EXF-2000]KAI6829918.1 NAD(P)-binding protein [Hortaea werneckii]KAI6926592.1 NAD(P)-binding protein [Hortaea werneckii]KAI6933720.1 NAD(P)-binding protein [Hortaea werneckii]
MSGELPLNMRAAQWHTTSGGIEKNLELNTEAATPKNAGSLPADHTLVKVLYSTPNPIDYKVADTLPFIFSKPATPCLDFAGKVVATKLPHLKPGEMVFGKTEPPAFGCLGEYVVVGKEGVVPLPPDVDPKQAACVGVTGLTAYQCIVPFAKPGNKIFINGGSGGTGTWGIQIAKAIGCEVTTTCSGANVELCKSLGADKVIDYRSEDVLSSLKRSGTQFDLVVDNVFPGPEMYWACPSFLKESGRYITIAGTPSVGSILDLLKVFLWPSFLGGGQRPFQFVMVQSSAEQYVQIGKWMEEGKVKAVIEQEFRLDEAGKAFERLKSGRTRGKLVIKVAGE